MKKIILIMLFVLGMVSCSDDSVTPQEAEATLIGTWESTSPGIYCQTSATLAFGETTLVMRIPDPRECETKDVRETSWRIAGENLLINGKLTYRIISLSKNTLVLSEEITNVGHQTTFKRK